MTFMYYEKGLPIENIDVCYTYEWNRDMYLEMADVQCRNREGYDLIWAKNTFNFARDDMDSLIAKIYAALNLGGVFSSCSEGLTHERTKPDNHVLSMISR